MYYKGEDYEKLDKMALRLRIDYGHLNSRLDVFKLAKQLNIVLIKYSSLNEKQLKVISDSEELKDGFTIIRKKKDEYEFYTFYNDQIGSARIRLTIAHEIKHVVFLEWENTTTGVLGHLFLLPLYALLFLLSRPLVVGSGRCAESKHELLSLPRFHRIGESS